MNTSNPAETQVRVIEFLSDPASYDAAGPVCQISTHCSIVFLVEKRAYKLKRAVKYSYLDYSTLALREKFCHAELALNQRTAPEIYLRVRPITLTTRGVLAFDGDGEVLDYVLEMRRFCDKDLFDQIVEADRLTPALANRLADTIAQFHADAERTPLHGGRDKFASTITGNYDNLILSLPALDRRLIERQLCQSRARMREVGDLMDERRDRGFTRRCHGDLHLRNICLFNNRPMLFDAIEFNDDISCIDVIYDLAFLLMDLVHRHRIDLANLIFNRYFDYTGDRSGLSPLPLFLSTRAAVRAHVQVALGCTSGDGRAPSFRTAADYLELALKLLEKHRPQLIALGGISGTGKSTIARALAPVYPPMPGARVLRSDILRKRLALVPAETRLPAESYTAAASREVYAKLRSDAIAIAATGYTVILDATFLSPHERHAVAEVAREAGLRFTGLWLEAPHDILVARVYGRQGDASDAGIAVLEQQLGVDPGRIEWQRIDASENMMATLAAVKTACGLK
ncbi:MAG TPA: AAA family ATPase [Gammaproteobacteria bacterium]|nr:AAA family ATPase [Gammaproteobacteria bacterium]